jgi:hypothetical protein
VGRRGRVRLPGRGPAERAALERAKAALDALDWYPRPVGIDRARILHVPWLFRVPGMRRYRGYELGPLILLRMPLAEAPPGLIVHELCHVWQHQHRPLTMWVSYLWSGYANNPHEIEARTAAGQVPVRRSPP